MTAFGGLAQKAPDEHPHRVDKVIE